MADAKKIVEGLTILLKHGEVEVEAQHDEIFAGAGLDGELTPAERTKLKNIGWRFDKEFDCWAHFT